MLRLFALLLVACGLALPAAAQPVVGPQPPCEGPPVYPPFGAIDGVPAVAIWHEANLQKLGWQPPACLGWQGDSRLVAALAVRFHTTQSLDALGARLAAVSHYPDIKFWAVTRQEWRPLANAAWVVAGPDNAQRLPDPAASALQPGHDVYYSEDADLAGSAIYRLHVADRSADRLVLETQNVSPIRVAILTVFEPAALQAATFLQRIDENTVALYEITRASMASSSMVTGYQSGYLNRLDAIHRLLAGQATDGAPPIAPH